MFCYERRLQYPVKIKQTDPKLAMVIISQFGGPDGELSAAMRYFSQKFATSNVRVAGLLNDIATEEFAHLEIIGTIVHQLTRNLSIEEIKASGFDKYYVDHTLAVWPQAASGAPFTATYFQSKGDPISDMFEDMAAEQKARTTYENILRLVKDCPDVADPIRFLRQREIVHFQRFGEGLRLITDDLDSRNFYAFNPDFNPGTICGDSRNNNQNQNRSNRSQGQSWNQNQNQNPNQNNIGRASQVNNSEKECNCMEVEDK